MGAEVLIIGGVLKDPLCAKITDVKELPRNEESPLLCLFGRLHFTTSCALKH